jgi:drug/metabolite transporter (DMT)-like permease
MIAMSAALGWILLKEPIDRLTASALTLLIGSLFLLSLGAEKAESSISRTASSGVEDWRYSVGIIAAFTAGLSYSLLGVIIRKVLQRSQIPVQTPIIFVSTVGAVGLGAWSLLKIGSEGLSEVPGGSWVIMVAAGLCNALAFLFLTYALRILPVVYVNAINVSQVAMAAALGVVVFREAVTPWLGLGLATMLLGFYLMAARTKANWKYSPG